MTDAAPAAALLSERRPARIYGQAALKAARHFWTAPADSRALALADALQRAPAVRAVTLLDAAGGVAGLVRRDELFALVGKPFGREVLGKMPASEVGEAPEILDSRLDLFTVARSVLGPEPGAAERFYPLVDQAGAFQGALSSHDLAAYLSGITQDDVDLAGALQARQMAANEAIGGASWRFEAWLRPARGVGGDFYVTRGLGGGRSFFALGDVSGKGAAAALIVSMAWAILRLHDFRRGLPALLKSLNESIVSTFHLEKYLTGFFAVWDEATRTALCADMGHSHVMLFKDGRARRLRGRKANLPIGVERDVEPLLYRISLAPGDALLAYSDGIVEQEDQAGREFSERALRDVAAAALAAGAPLAPPLEAAIAGYRGPVPQQDDMSFALLAVRPPSA
jgi:sigma-B regulation protein RsbU (phosphoserine phosphatase)